eukprot:751546-Hanusia_phi.AAC.2
MMIAASNICTVFGITASVVLDPTHVWLYCFISCIFFVFEMIVAFAIFAITIHDFETIASPMALKVVQRLKTMRVVFYVSWMAYPILWSFSSTGACIMSENTSSVLYLLGDALCKNTYGILLWATTWGLLNGKWDRDYVKGRNLDGTLMPEYEKDLEKGNAERYEDARAGETFDVKMFGRTLTSVRRSRRRPRRDIVFSGGDRNRLSESDSERRRRRKKYQRKDSESEYSSDESHASDYEKKNKRKAKKKNKENRKTAPPKEDSTSETLRDAEIKRIMDLMKRNAGNDIPGLDDDSVHRGEGGLIPARNEERNDSP